MIQTQHSSGIHLAELHKSYGEGAALNPVLRGLSLEIAPGEMVAITGASGSGKSTLLNIVGGLDQNYRGVVEVGGLRLQTLGDRALSRYRNRTIGFIFQQFHLIPHLTVADNVAVPSWFGGAEATLAEVRAALGRVGLEHKVDARPNHLSGGERQRVAIARALLGRPDILLCDEPTGALDSATSARVFGLIEALHREDGKTVIVVTHEQALAARCPRRVHLVDGNVARDERNDGENAVNNSVIEGEK